MQVQQKLKSKVIILLVFMLLFAFAIMAFYLGGNESLSAEALQVHQQQLLTMVKENYLLSSFLYMLIFIISVSFSLPVFLLMTVLGGYLFPQPYAIIYALLAGTIGAVVIFVIAGNFKELFKNRMGSRLTDLEKGLRGKDSSIFLWSVRLIPVFPYWLVNIAAGIFKISFWTLVWTTFLGILPTTIVFTLFGQAIAAAIDSDVSVPIYEVLIYGGVFIGIIIIEMGIIYDYLKKIYKT